MTSSARQLKQQALKLSKKDRIALALALWESMPSTADSDDEAERAYAAGRLAEHKQQPKQTIPWSESKRRMAKKTTE